MGEAQTRYARDKFLAGVESEFQKMGFKPLEQKEPEEVREKSLWDYVTEGDIVDAFAAGIGTTGKYVGHAIEEYTRPDDKTPTEWHEQAPSWVKTLQTEGQAMAERNAHQYEDNTPAYHLNNIVTSAPSTLAILGAAFLGSRLLGPAVGAGGTAAINYALRSGKARQLAWDFAKAYQGSSLPAKIARATIPTDARTLTAWAAGLLGEAELEKQGVEEEYLEDARRNGTYRKDDSELAAEAAGDEARWKNAAIIGLTGAPQTKILFGNKPAKGLLGKIKDTAIVGGTEAIEEVLQEIANLSALDKPTDTKRLRDAAIAGAGMGTGMHGIGLGADYIANRGKPSEEETEATLKELAKQKSDGESELYGQFREEVQNTIDPNRNAYRGENGKGEGKYWELNHNMGASLEGVQPDLLNAIDMLGKYYYDYTGKRLVINAGTNGSHADGEHSHANGWKVDVVDAGGSDVGMDEDGPLTTRGFNKGWFADDFIAYGRSLGLGMNWEGGGTENVHLDITLDGTQWDGNGEHAGGFNSGNVRSHESSEQENSYDPNFTDRQNHMWELAQYASQRLRNDYGIRLAPELIFRQWTLEDGGEFTHSSRNWGGLKDTSGNFRSFDSDQEYADAYIDEFIKYYPEINGVKNEREFASILKSYD